MAVARETVRLGLSARAAAKVKLRQPLHEAVVVADGAERAAIERLPAVVREELNVKTLRFVERADELGSYEVKPNYRTLGPRFGKAMPQVAARRGRPRPRRTSRVSCARAATIGIAVDGHDHELGPEDLRARPCGRSRATSSSARARTPWRWSSRSTTTCAARVSRARSSMPSRDARKAAGLAVEDRIALTLGGDDVLLAAARAHEPYVTGETLATRVEYLDNGAGTARDHRGSRAADRCGARGRLALG